MARILDMAMTDGAWGLSTSFFDEDRTGRPVPSRFADDAELEALTDVIARHRSRPDRIRPRPHRRRSRGRHAPLARLCGPRGIPLTWTGFTHSDSNPARTEHWLELTRQFQAEGVKFWPQLSPRTVDFRLNWDSSMMFMAMPKGWHRVIQAQGADKARLLADEAWRHEARCEWDVVEKAIFPHRRIENVRIVEVAGSGRGSMARTLAGRPGRRAGRSSLGCARRFHVGQRLPSRAGGRGYLEC